jgi:hypothetical protein
MRWDLIEAPIPNAPEGKYISQIPSPNNLLMVAGALTSIGEKQDIHLHNFLKDRYPEMVFSPNIIFNLGEATCMDYLYNYALTYLNNLRRMNPKSNIYLTGYHAWLHKEKFKDFIMTTPHYFENDVIGKPNDETEWHNDWSVNDWEWMDRNVKSVTKGIRVTIRASRGCPHNCIMCPVKITYKKKIRRFSVCWVLEEIDHLYYNYGIRQIGFLDDNLFYNRKWGKQLLAEIISNKYKGLSLTFEEGLDVPTALDEELVEMMHRAGFTHMKLGVESFNPKTLKFINKPYQDPDMAIRAIRLLQKHKMNPTCFICIGFPTDTYESIESTINKLIELKVKLRVQILWAYPGIDFVGKSGLTKEQLKTLQQKAMNETGSCSWHHPSKSNLLPQEKRKAVGLFSMPVK